MALGRLAEVHRQRSGDDEERLLLRRVAVTAPCGARLVPPDVRAGVGESGELAQLGDVACRRAGLVWPRDPLECLGGEDSERHAGHSSRGSSARTRTRRATLETTLPYGGRAGPF